MCPHLIIITIMMENNCETREVTCTCSCTSGHSIPLLQSIISLGIGGLIALLLFQEFLEKHWDYIKVLIRWC